MTFFDFILLPIFLFIFWIIGLSIKNVKYNNDLRGKYFLKGLLIKIIGALAFALIYTYYYQGGDTFAYYDSGIAWETYFLNEPENAWQFIFTTDYVDHIQRLKMYAPSIENVHIIKLGGDMTMIKIMGLLIFLMPNSFVLTTLVFAFITYFGIWSLYSIFIAEYPDLNKQLAISVLFIPSIVFWGSGLMKDTVTLSALGFFTYGSYYLFFKKRKIIFSLIVLLISGYIIAELKGYILLAFIPALSLWLLQAYKNKINSKFLRIAITPALILVMSVLGVLLLNQIGDILGRYSLENIEGAAKDYQSWHQVASAEGSSYTIGNGITDFTLSGILTNFPAAVNVALFRPYLWEANSAVMLLSAVESLILLLYFLHTLLITGLLKFFKIIFQNPFLTFCFAFSIIFAFAVGYTSFNFGALVRYKIPLIPFFVSLLIIVRYNYTQQKNLK